MKFRKLPVVVEAHQVTVENLEELADWSKGVHKGGKLDRCHHIIDIDTLEGMCRAEVGDWIIKGVEGEFYPCRNSIFLKSYEFVWVSVSTDQSDLPGIASWKTQF